MLLLDIGNTTIKYRIYKEDKCVDSGLITKIELAKRAEEENEFKAVSTIFFADVRGGFSSFLSQNFPKAKQVSLQSNDLKYPFINAYQTPETLGSDRKALVAAAYFVYPKTHCLVIDAGSCITYDYIDDSGVYHGGAISPGIVMRYRALHQQTGKLPDLTPSITNTFVGQSTDSAIHGGIFQGVLGEILHQISYYQENFENLHIVLTGGDWHWLFKNIKKPIFAEPNFLLDGMFALWQYNKNS